MGSDISGLVNNITDSISSLTSIFNPSNTTQGAFPDAYKNQAFISQIKAANWVKNAGYAFSIQDDTGGSVAGFSDFPLNINPTEISQDETFAVNMIPTQGGTNVNHNGNRYKDLMVSGTTGIAPNAGVGGTSVSTGKAILQPNDLKHLSGFEVFLRFRNWIKAYYQFQKDTPSANARLVFQNFKDGEFLLIEIPKFTMKRSANKPHMYDYVINAKVLGHQTFKVPSATGFLAQLDGYLDAANNALGDAVGILYGTQNILRQIAATYDQAVLEPLRKATLIVKAFLGIGLTALDLGRNLANETMSAAEALGIAVGLASMQQAQNRSGTTNPNLVNVKFPANLAQAIQKPSDLLQFGTALSLVPIGQLPAAVQASLLADQQAALNLPRSFFQDAIATISSVENNAYDKFNLTSPVYNAEFDHTPTLSGVAGAAITDDDYSVLSALDLSTRGLEYLISNSAIFKSPYAARIAQTNTAFNDNLGLLTDTACKEIQMPHNVDLERLALQQLGDSTRWVEIAELNNLVAPFVIQDMSDTTTNVIHPGQKILIPTSNVNGFGTTPISHLTFINEDLTAQEKNLGIDFKLGNNMDLILTKSGDLQIVSAESNAAQAIVLKLSIEKGELLEHPELGVGLIVGERSPDLNEVRSQLISTMLQDPRFQKIENVILFQEGSSLRVKFTLYVKNVDIPLPVDIKI